MDAYLFDFGNVVVRFDHWRFCNRLAAETRCISAERIYHSVFSGTLNERFELGRISGEELYESVAKDLGLATPMEQFKDIWCDIFTQNPGMVEMIQTLRTSSRVILISNTNQWHIEYLRTRFSCIFECFDALILSYEIGMRKPDLEIFWRAVTAAGTDPSRCLYFDDLEGHVMAARTVGMNAVLFRYV